MFCGYPPCLYGWEYQASKANPGIFRENATLIHKHDTKTERALLMKQRVVVQAIIQDRDKILFLRRSQGRPGIVGKFELPGGTLEDNEQPDDGMRRHLHNDIGVDVQNLQLEDVMSMTDREEGDVQHVFIVYRIDNVSKDTPLRPGRSYDKYEWKSKSEIQQNEFRNSAYYLLNSKNTTAITKSTEQSPIKNVDVNTSYKTRIVIYSDGGSRGNPGPSAAAFVILDNETVIDQGGEYIGITTNNQAEYHGVLLGLERAVEKGIDALEFRIDSMLVVNQLNGLYKIKNRELWPVNERVQTLLSKFKSVKFHHVPRELNKMADALVNKLLDEHQNDIE
ncbi:reverse transcriptase-like protein [Patescibacteria group bacterium]|nr:MAG: reverse transcriptase-like protein [Patescibacteria group bacterium]